MQTLNQFQETFETYLRENRFRNSPTELYEPANYILSLGGKRLRPALVLASHYIFDTEVTKSLPAAMAVETFHNFSLVHDDIMDNAPFRRGKLTVHSKFGLNTAILSGDAMLVLAYDFLLKSNTPHIVELLQIFSKMAIQICEGQQMDMNFEVQKVVSIDEYLKMIELKTAVLVATSLNIGALIGGATQNDANVLYEFGKNLGMAFQLQDDILDAYGDPSKFGKKTGGDIVQNKKTYLYLKTLEVAPHIVVKELQKLYASETEDEARKIEIVLSLFNQYDIKSLTMHKIDEYWQKSMGLLSQINGANGRKSLLENFANALMERDF